MISFFSCCWPFEGRHAKRQTKSVLSWKRSCPDAEIILIGNHSSIEKTCQDLNLVYIPEVEYSKSGAPMVNSAFQLAYKKAKFDILCWINTDIILVADLPKVIASVPFKKFLLVGQRIDYDPEIDINNLDIEKIKLNGKLHPPCGIDYHIFTREVYDIVPPFIKGRSRYDNWLIWEALRKKVPVIDCTEAIICIHQNHPSWMTRANTDIAREEVAHNISLCPQAKGVNDANYILKNYAVLPRKC